MTSTLLRIAYARMNSDVHLRPDSTVGQGVEHRRSFLNALVEQGLDVTIISTISPKDLPLLSGNTLLGSSWYRKLHYDLDATGSEFDIFILEAASQNAAFSRNINGIETNVIPFVFSKLKKFSGTIFLWHHIYGTSTIIPFSTRDNYNKEDLTPLDQINPKNWRLWFSDFDPYENKEWHIIHHSLNEEALKDLKSRFSSSYRSAKIAGFHYLHLPQSKLDPYFDINASPKYDSMWIGSRYTHSTRYDEYDRASSIMKFYDTPLYKTSVIGDMESFEAKRHGILKDEIKFKYADTGVSKSNVAVAVSLWNNSYTHIFTESEEARRIGSITGRTFLSLRGGSTLLVDKSISNVEKLGLRDYEVADAEEAKQKIAEIKSKSPSQRDSIRKEQLATFPDWLDIDWTSFFTNPNAGFNIEIKSLSESRK